MLKIRAYKAEDAIELLKDPNEIGLSCYPDMVKEERAKLYETAGPSYTVTLNGRVVGCGGICTLWQGVGEAWAIYAKGIGREHIDPQVAKDLLYDMIDEGNFIRVQATPRADWPKGVKYVEYLGFQREGLMRSYHDKIDCIMFSIIREI